MVEAFPQNMLRINDNDSSMFGVKKVIHPTDILRNHFRTYDKNRTKLTPAAVTNGLANTIVDVCGLDKKFIILQIKHPAELACWTFGTPLPMPIAEEVIDVLSKYKKVLGDNWPLRRDAFLGRATIPVENAPDSSDGEGEDDDHAEPEGGNVASDPLEEQDDPPVHEVFEAMTLAGNTIAAGSLMGGFATPTVNLSHEHRVLVRSLNEHNRAVYQAAQVVYEYTDIDIIKFSMNDFMRQNPDEMPKTPLENFLGLETNKGGYMVAHMENAMLEGEKKDAVAGRVLSEALAITPDPKEKFPVTQLYEELHLAAVSLRQLGDPPKQRVQSSWFVEALKRSEHPTLHALGLKTETKCASLLKQSKSTNGDPNMFRDLAKFAREHTLSMQFVPDEADKDTGKGKRGGGGGGGRGKGGHDGPSELANYGGQGRGTGGGGGGSGGNCHRCGKPGHRAANCTAPSPISDGKGSKDKKDKAKDGKGGKGGKGATGDPSKGHGKGKGKGVNKLKTGYAGAARKAIDDSASESTSESSKVSYGKFKLKGMGRSAAKESEEEEVDDDDNVSEYADLLIEVHNKVHMMEKDLGKVKFKNGKPRHSKSEIKAIVDKYRAHLYNELYDDESS